MGLRNHYAGTFAVVAFSGLALLMLIPEDSIAVGSDDATGQRNAAAQSEGSAGGETPAQSKNAVSNTAAVSKRSGVQGHALQSPVDGDVQQASGTASSSALTPNHSSVQQVSGSTPTVNAQPQPLVALGQSNHGQLSSGQGLPEGAWTRDTPLGRVELTVAGNKISIQMAGTGEFNSFQPSLRGEFSVASDGTVYGLIHNLDLGVSEEAAAELGDELILLSGLSDLPFMMRTYSDDEVMAVKQLTFGLPTAMLLTSGSEHLETSAYVQSMLSGQYERMP